MMNDRTNDDEMYATLNHVRNREDLARFWSTQYPTRLPIVEFYGHNPDKMGLLACFSNFYRAEEAVPFTIPNSCWERFARIQGCNIETFERTTNVYYSEQSIMLCKAAVMGDGETYNAIRSAKTPRDAKKLGRLVSPFCEETWQSVILEVAFESVYQKFIGLRTAADGDAYLLREFNFLMKTGDALIVEAAPRDFIWGVGSPIGHPNCQDPRKWVAQNGKGRNVLGFALMKARDRLREEFN